MNTLDTGESHTLPMVECKGKGAQEVGNNVECMADLPSPDLRENYKHLQYINHHYRIYVLSFLMVSLNKTSVVARIIISQVCLHLIPGTHAYVTLHGKRALRMQVELKSATREQIILDYLSGTDVITRVLKNGRGRQKEQCQNEVR